MSVWSSKVGGPRRPNADPLSGEGQRYFPPSPVPPAYPRAWPSTAPLRRGRSAGGKTKPLAARSPSPLRRTTRTVGARMSVSPSVTDGAASAPVTGLSALTSWSPPPRVPPPLFLAVPLLLKSATGGPPASPRRLHNVTFHPFRLPSGAPQPNFAAGPQGAGLGRGAAAARSQ